MYTIIWIFINMIILAFGYGFKSGFYWIVQVIFIVGLFIKEDR